jgi:hypothetical protein
MFPGDTHFAEFEAVPVFKIVHLFGHIMRDERLQFTDKALKDSHFVNRHESGIFQGSDMPRDGREVAVNVVQAAVGFKLAFKMVSSQGFLLDREFWSGLHPWLHTGAPDHTLAREGCGKRK